MALTRYKVQEMLNTRDGIIIHVGAEITIPSERARKLIETGAIALANDIPDTVYEEPPPAEILTPVEPEPQPEPTPDEVPGTGASF